MCRHCGRDLVTKRLTEAVTGKVQGPKKSDVPSVGLTVPEGAKYRVGLLAILAVSLVVGGLWYRQKAEQTKLANQQAEQAKAAQQKAEQAKVAREKAEQSKAAQQKAEQEEKDRQWAEWERKSHQWDAVIDKIVGRFDEIFPADMTRFFHCRSDQELNDEKIRLAGLAASKKTEIGDITADLSWSDFPGAGNLKMQVFEFFLQYDLMISSERTYATIAVMLGREDAESKRLADEATEACLKLFSPDTRSQRCRRPAARASDFRCGHLEPYPSTWMSIWPSAPCSHSAAASRKWSSSLRCNRLADASGRRIGGSRVGSTRMILW